MPSDIQVAVLWAVQHGYLDQVPVDRVKEYQRRLTEYLTSSRSDMLARIGTERALSDALIPALQDACDAFARLWT